MFPMNLEIRTANELSVLEDALRSCRRLAHRYTNDEILAIDRLLCDLTIIGEQHDNHVLSSCIDPSEPHTPAPLDGIVIVD
jgi:hypothetical protein